MLTAEIKKMSINKKILLMEELWNSICSEEIEIESPAWHKDILDERINLINSGKAHFISIKDLKNANL